MLKFFSKHGPLWSFMMRSEITERCPSVLKLLSFLHKWRSKVLPKLHVQKVYVLTSSKARSVQDLRKKDDELNTQTCNWTGIVRWVAYMYINTVRLIPLVIVIGTE